MAVAWAGLLALPLAFGLLFATVSALDHCDPHAMTFAEAAREGDDCLALKVEIARQRR